MLTSSCSVVSLLFSYASANNGCDQREVGAEQGGPQPGARTTESGSRVVEKYPRVSALDVGLGERLWASVLATLPFQYKHANDA